VHSKQTAKLLTLFFSNIATFIYVRNHKNNNTHVQAHTFHRHLQKKINCPLSIMNYEL